MTLNKKHSAFWLGIIWTLASTPIHAQISPMKLSLRLTATVDEVAEYTETGGRYRTSTTNWTEVDLLRLSQKALNTSFPNGSSLVQWGPDIVVVDQTGTNVVVNLTSSNIAVITFPNMSVGTGRWISKTLEQIHFEKFILKLSFDDRNGNTFNLVGMARDTFSIGPRDMNGNQKLSSSTSASFIGQGLVDGKNAVFSGNFSTRGVSTVAIIPGSQNFTERAR